MPEEKWAGLGWAGPALSVAVSSPGEIFLQNPDAGFPTIFTDFLSVVVRDFDLFGTRKMHSKIRREAPF
jgi:hypothetical protein